MHFCLFLVYYHVYHTSKLDITNGTFLSYFQYIVHTTTITLERGLWYLVNSVFG